MKREKELKQLTKRLKLTTSQLEELNKRRLSGDSSDEDDARLRQVESEKRLLQSELKDVEAQYSRLEAAKRNFEGENQRLLTALSDKETEVKVSTLYIFSPKSR